PMFCSIRFILMFLLFFNITICTTNGDVLSNNNFAENTRLKEKIDKLIEDFEPCHLALKDFLNCFERYIVVITGKYEASRNCFEATLKGELRDFTFDSTLEIFKRGFNVDDLAVFYNKIGCWDFGPYVRFFILANIVQYNLENVKDRCHSIEIVRNFYVNCIEKGREIIKNYNSIQLDNDASKVKCIEQLKEIFEEYKNLHYTEYEFLSNFYDEVDNYIIVHEDFSITCKKLSDQFKYRLIFGSNCKNLKTTGKGFNESFIKKGISEIKELEINIYKFFDDLKNKDEVNKCLKDAAKKFEFIYNCELTIRKSVKLYEFFNKYRFNIKRTCFNNGETFEEDVDEVTVNEYLVEIQALINRIKTDTELKITTNIIWHNLLIFSYLDDTILNDFIHKKTNQLEILSKEGEKNMREILLNTFEMNLDQNIDDIYINKSKNLYLPRFFSDFEYDYIYLTSYFLSSDLLSESSTLVLFERFLLAKSKAGNIRLKICHNRVYKKSKKLLKWGYRILDLLDVVVKLMNFLENEKLFLLERI
ncbi:hypothetical protein H312_03132, partial [Anncaliia algerae PRA339]